MSDIIKDMNAGFSAYEDGGERLANFLTAQLSPHLYRALGKATELHGKDFVTDLLERVCFDDIERVEIHRHPSIVKKDHG